MKGVDTIVRIRREFFIRGRSIKDIVRDLHVFRDTQPKLTGNLDRAGWEATA